MLRILCFFGFWCGFRYKAEDGDEARHERTDDVEETEGQVHHCGDAEHGTLRHAACCPRNEDGGDGGTVFGAAAEQFGTVASTFVFLAKNGGVHDDSQELVTHNHIQEYAASYRGAHKADGAVDGAEQEACEAVQHIACHHA